MRDGIDEGCMEQYVCSCLLVLQQKCLFLMIFVFCGTLQGVSMSRRNEDEQSYFDR